MGPSRPAEKPVPMEMVVAMEFYDADSRANFSFVVGDGLHDFWNARAFGFLREKVYDGADDEPSEHRNDEIEKVWGDVEQGGKTIEIEGFNELNGSFEKNGNLHLQ